MKRLALAIALAACGGAADPGLRMAAAPRAQPAEVSWAELSFEGRGVKLYAQRWRPASGEVKAVLVIHHGLADHGALYEVLAQKLARAGYAVWAMDMRGHAHSAGVRVSANSIDELLDDLGAFVKLVGEQEPGKPMYLFGHSLGGLISTLFVVERQPQLAGLLLSGPGIAFDAPPLQAAAVRFIAAINPNAPVLDTPHKDFTSSKEIVAAMDKDPMIFQGKGPARTARAAVDAAHRVWAAPEKITMPLLVLAGSVDKLVAPSGGRDLVARAGTTDKLFVLYDKFDHDLMHEPPHGENAGAERVQGDIQAWLDAHVSGSPAPFTQQSYGKLKGDRPSSLMQVDLDLRGELPRPDAGIAHDPIGVTGGMRFRIGFGGPVGYVGGLDLRGGYLEGGFFEGNLHAAGLAVRTRGGALFAVSGGAGILRAGGATSILAPAELSLEAPVGSLRLIARGELAWRIAKASFAEKALGLADTVGALLAVRIGADLPYWSSVVAGAGPYLGVTYRNAGGYPFFGFVLGGDLFGAN